MPTFLQLAGFGLAGLAGWCLLMLRRSRARKKDPRLLFLELLVKPGSRLAPLVLPAFAWGAAAVLAAAPLRWPDPRLLVPVAVLAGLVPLPGAALGAALAYSFVLPDPALLLTVAAPLTAGALVRLVHVRPVRWWSFTAFARTMGRWGSIVVPPMPVDWFWSVIGAAAALSPLVALALTLDGPDLGLRAVCAVLVSVQLGTLTVVAQRRHRWVRRMCRGALAAASAAAALVASGRAGAWLVERWLSAPYLTGLLGGAILSAVAVFAWTGRYDDLGLWRLVTQLLRVLTGFGLLPFWIVTVFHPVHDLLVAATVLIGAETVLVLVHHLTSMGSRLEQLEERMYAQTVLWDPLTRVHQLGPWLYDGFLSRPGHVDYTPVRVCLGMAVLGARGHAAPGQRYAFKPGSSRPLAGLEALRWTQAAGQSIDLVDSEVAGRLPAGLRDGLRRHQDLARADLAAGRAVVLSYAFQWQDALNEFRDATQRYRVLGETEGENLGRTGAAWILAFHLSQPGAAARELALLAPSAAPDGLTRWARVVAGAVALANGDGAAVSERLRQARALPSEPRLGRAHPAFVTGVTEIIAAVETHLNLLLSSELSPQKRE
ncbi:hypothetical protein [Nonomuraea sp. KM90]|uniref:hypothetical protein n=1 Tax=Nonomuraea sp. KM90 TaxID=3457428 RepID=UPI003FCE2BD7